MEKTLHFKPIKIAILLLSAVIFAETLGLTRDPAGNPVRFFSDFFNSLFAANISNWLNSIDWPVSGFVLLILMAILLILSKIATAFKN